MKNMEKSYNIFLNNNRDFKSKTSKSDQMFLSSIKKLKIDEPKENIEPEIFEHDDLYGEVNLREFDPLNFQSSQVIIRQEVKKHHEEVGEIKKVNSKICHFLKSTEEYLTQNGLDEIIPFGIDDEQKLSVIFYKLFKAVDVPTIEAIYLTALRMEIKIPDIVYEILKVCRLSYHGSMALFKEIGDHTKFHRFFYDNVLQQSLYFLSNSQNRNKECFSELSNVFMSARYNLIPLSGRIINRILYVISIYEDYTLFGIVLEYGIKQEISSSCITDAYQFFKKSPEILSEFFQFFNSHLENNFIANNLNNMLNHLILIICELQLNELLIEVLQLMIEKGFFLDIYSLDSIFSSPSATCIDNLLHNVIGNLVDVSDNFSFGSGSFTEILWMNFKEMIEDNLIEETLPLLSLLIRTDPSKINKELLLNYYRFACDQDYEEAIINRIRGFIQSFECF